jgi:hypothetical protein
MQLTANHETLVAIRTLVDYLAADERKDYQGRLEQGNGDGHIYETIAQIEKWLSGQTEVLHMVAGSDDSWGLPEADCVILTAEEATKRFQAMLDDHQLPPIQYNAATDKVLAHYEPSDAMRHRFYGFVPLVAEAPAGYTGLTYERPGFPLDSWCVEVNDVVVYQEEEEGGLVVDSETDEEDFAQAPVHDKQLLGD